MRSAGSSYLEDRFQRLVFREQLPQPAREFKYYTYRFDFAWPSLKVAVEVDGGTFSGGNHVRGKGYQRDCKKMNQAQLDGWVVLRADREMVGTEEFGAIVRKMLLKRIECLTKPQ